MKSKNKQILKVTALYVIWNPEIYQDFPTCGQDDPVLFQKNPEMYKDKNEIDFF